MMDKRKILQSLLSGNATQLQQLLPVYDLNRLTTEQLLKLRSHEIGQNLLAEDELVGIAECIISPNSAIKTRGQKIKLIKKVLAEVHIEGLVNERFPYTLLFSKKYFFCFSEATRGVNNMLKYDNCEIIDENGVKKYNYSITEERYLGLKSAFDALPEAQKLSTENNMFLGMCTFSEHEALKHHLYHVED